MRALLWFSRAAGTLVFGAAVAACGGSGASLPAQPGPVPVGAETNPAGTGNLLYVSDLNKNDVFVFSYPGAKLRQTLTGFHAVHYECHDANGNVFIAEESASKVLEYARGGTRPIHTFNTPGSTPNGCAIDPTTGNLAIIYNPLGSGAGAIAVYRHATGKPKTYTTPNIFFYYFVGYDAVGNLFVDGTNMHVTFGLAELPAGSKTAQAITLDHSVSLPGAIQWDGQYLAVGDQVCINCASQIDRFAISGTNGTLMGTVAMTDSCDVLQFWIYNEKVVAANDCGSTVKYFNYPAGGMSLKTIASPLSQPVGVMVDPAP